MKKIILLLIFLSLVFPAVTLATIGVGVGTGKIQVNSKLKPGIIYQLPSVTVINNGDEPSDYEVTISYNNNQTQLRPPLNWFIFSPQKFHLSPNKAQQVNIKVNLPVSGITPGDYFAYIEAHPVKISEAGTTSINIAAASKLYFTIEPASFFAAIYYKLVSFWELYTSWIEGFVGLLFLALIAISLKKALNIKIEKIGKIPNFIIILIIVISVIIYAFFWINFFKFKPPFLP